MQIKTQFDHSSDNVFTAMGVDKEKLSLLIDRVNQIGSVTRCKSEVIEQVIKLCKDPTELFALAFIMGEQEACKDCPIKKLGEFLNR